ncbi:acetyl-CoA carboxylase carboxyltransferase subunit beta [Candidatus Solincola sp.]|nr:acetyl-CoA carboxylase carboxyltransferase subunit beta [Actinomycetota bacterium]
MLRRRERASRLWKPCAGCGLRVEVEVLAGNLGVCPLCGHHHRLAPQERAAWLFDAGTFRPRRHRMRSTDPLGFYAHSDDGAGPGPEEPVIYGPGNIAGRRCVAALMDFFQAGGSLGAVAGELICRAGELARSEELPLLLVTASGGARVQEGTLALLQMAKTMVTMNELHEEGIPVIALLCDPTCGGVAASFAYAADFILAEPGALICFTGPRVAEQAAGIRFPEGFARAERLLERGLVDMVVPRREQRRVIGDLLAFLEGRG